MERIKQIGVLVFRLGVSVILLVLLFRFNKIDLQVLISDIRGADKFLLAFGFLLCLVVYALSFLRWKMLLVTVGIDIPLKRLIASYAGGVFFSIFLPSTIGGDLLRVTDLAKYTNKAREVVATVFLDRFSGYIGLVLVVILALLLGGGLVLDRVVLTSVAVLIIVLVLVLLVLFNQRIYAKITQFLTAPGAGKIKAAIKNMHQEIHLFRNHPKMILKNLSISFLVQLIWPVCIYFIALALGVKINFIYYIIFVPLIGAITLLPIALGGLGLREGLFVMYFAKAGVAKQLALAMSLLSFSFTFSCGAIGGLIYVLTVHYRRLQSHSSSGI